MNLIHWHILTYLVNTLRLRQNDRHFADDKFKCIFLNVNIWISIKISLKFPPKDRSVFWHINASPGLNGLTKYLSLSGLFDYLTNMFLIMYNSQFKIQKVKWVNPYIDLNWISTSELISRQLIKRLHMVIWKWFRNLATRSEMSSSSNRSLWMWKAHLAANSQPRGIQCRMQNSSTLG